MMFLKKSLSINDMKMIYRKLIVLLPVVLILTPAFTQDLITKKKIAEECVKKYEISMTLGKGGTNEMNPETMKEFKSLFELGANVYWDLYIVDTLKYKILSVDEYLDNAFTQYGGQKPLVSFPSKKPVIKMDKSQNSATVFALKYNQVSLPDKKGLETNKIRLRMKLNLYEDKALIANIMKDTRHTITRSISANLGYIVWGNLNQKIVNPSSSQADSISGSYSVTSTPLFVAGLGLEFRLNRDKFDGIILETCLNYSQGKYDVAVNDYEYSYRQIIDEASDNPFECSVFDRSKQIIESIDYFSFTLPLAVKYYPEKLSWLYIKGGPLFSFNSWNMEAVYDFSHTGGGNVVNLTSGKDFNVSVNDEFNVNYGFFKSESQDLSVDPGFSNFTVSFMLGTGFEKKWSHFSLGLEPVLIIGPNGIQVTDTAEEYLIYPGPENPDYSYQSFLKSLELPSVNISGMLMLKLNYFFIKK
jgi:hypothetical protein